MLRMLSLLPAVLFFSLTLHAQDVQTTPATLNVAAPGAAKADGEAIVKGDGVGFSPAINPYVIAGGGGTSAAGTFSLDGTIGQAAAGGNLSGGNFTVSSGFWNAVVTPSGSTPKKRPGQITSQ